MYDRICRYSWISPNSFGNSLIDQIAIRNTARQGDSNPCWNLRLLGKAVERAESHGSVGKMQDMVSDVKQFHKWRHGYRATDMLC